MQVILYADESCDKGINQIKFMDMLMKFCLDISMYQKPASSVLINIYIILDKKGKSNGIIYAIIQCPSKNTGM